MAAGLPSKRRPFQKAAFCAAEQGLLKGGSDVFTEQIFFAN
jgi:hypothetical protein